MKKILLFFGVFLLIFTACDNNYCHENICKISLVNKHYMDKKFDLYIDSCSMDVKREYWVYKQIDKKIVDSVLVIEYKIPQVFVQKNDTTSLVEFLDDNNAVLYQNDDFYVNGGFHFIFRINENREIYRNAEDYKIYSDGWDCISSNDWDKFNF